MLCVQPPVFLPNGFLTLLAVFKTQKIRKTDDQLLGMSNNKPSLKLTAKASETIFLSWRAKCFLWKLVLITICFVAWLNWSKFVTSLKLQVQNNKNEEISGNTRCQRCESNRIPSLFDWAICPRVNNVDIDSWWFWGCCSVGTRWVPSWSL